MMGAELRRLFDVASKLAAGDREQEASDKELVVWIGEQIGQRGLTALANELI
jgi:hypothetical protein